MDIVLPTICISPFFGEPGLINGLLVAAPEMSPVILLPAKAVIQEGFEYEVEVTTPFKTVPLIVELNVFVPPIVWSPVVYTPFVTVPALPLIPIAHVPVAFVPDGVGNVLAYAYAPAAY